MNRRDLMKKGFLGALAAKVLPWPEAKADKPLTFLGTPIKYEKELPECEGGKVEIEMLYKVICNETKIDVYLYNGEYQLERIQGNIVITNENGRSLSCCKEDDLKLFMEKGASLTGMGCDMPMMYFATTGIKRIE